MSTPNERLKLARKTAGFSTATDAVSRFGWKKATYLAHENGSRGYPKARAEAYAKAFKISLAWLISGRGEMKDGKTVPLMGIVGAGGNIMPASDNPNGLEQVGAPPEMGPDTVAVQVRGDSMYPAFDDGDLIYYDRHETMPDSLPSKPCIAQLADGRCMLKLVRKGSRKGLYSLMSHNAPPIEDVRLVWVAKIKWIKKP